MQTILKQLKDKLQKFEGIESSENDVSNRVVLWLLEEYLGYDREDMRWEPPIREKKKDRRIDIMITLSKEKRLLVETKRYENDLDEVIEYINDEEFVNVVVLLTKKEEIKHIFEERIKDKIL